MGYILLGLSALALAGAGILWRADAQDKSRTSEDGTAPRDAEPVAPTPVEDVPEEAAPAEPEVEPEKEPEPQLEAEEEEAPQPQPELEAEPEPEAEAEPETAEEGSEENQKTHSRWSALTGLTGAFSTKLPKNLPTKLPGAKQRSRKERREWAEANGFEYAREDEFLQDEWGRGAASAGEPVTDVLTGTRFGHETRIADIGGTTVVAMGTGMESGVVVDVRRKATASGATEDLVAVAEIEGFRVYGSEAGPAERMLEIRANTALELLPQQVSAVWFESEWVLAQLDGDAGAQEWEPVFAPLALLADAARTLPPRTWPHLRFEHHTREMGDPIEIQSSKDREGTEAERPVVVRPEEPLELPTRTTGGVRGTMEYRVVGGDEVEAIATGEAPEQLNDGTRITRRPQPPSIFGDSNRDYPG